MQVVLYNGCKTAVVVTKWNWYYV